MRMTLESKECNFFFIYPTVPSEVLHKLQVILTNSVAVDVRFNLFRIPSFSMADMSSLKLNLNPHSYLVTNS